VRRLRAARLATREAQQAARDDYVSPALALLGDLILRQGEELDPWAVSLACWSYGVLDHHDDDVLGVLCRRGATCLRAFQPIDCASALVGWARLRVRTRPQREFVDQLLSQSLDSLSLAPGDWQPQELANAAWALAKIGAAGSHRRALLDTLMDVVQWRLDDFNMQVGAASLCFGGGCWRGGVQGVGAQSRPL
jgi:hypothetical protein